MASAVTTGSASSNNGDNKFEGVEQFQWYEFEDPLFQPPQGAKKPKKGAL